MGGRSQDARPGRAAHATSGHLATIAGFAGSLAALAANVACSTPPPPAECERFADHLVDLLAQTKASPAAVRRRAGGLRERMVASCRTQGSTAAVECVLRHDTLAGIEADCR